MSRIEFACPALVFVSYILATINADSIPALRDAVKYVHVSKTDDKHVFKVTIDRSESVKIINNASPTLAQRDYFGSSIDKSIALYTAASCKIANWHAQKIYEFVKFSPLFYQQNFKNHTDLYLGSYENNFKSSLTSLMLVLDDYAVKSMNALRNILDTFFDISFYSDTTVFQTLVSLRVKINLMTPNSEIPINDDATSDYNQILLLLEEMNAFQRFLSMHCVNTSSTQTNSWFFGYWSQTVNEHPDTFFRLTENLPLTLENEHDCLIEHMFLEVLLKFDCIGDEIFRTTAIVVNGMHSITSIKISDIFNLIKSSQDSDMVFLYQDFVFVTFMKLIFTKVKQIRNVTELPSSVKTKIDELSRDMFNDETVFPQYLAEGFRILSAYIERKNTEDTKSYNNFYKYALDMVVLPESSSCIETNDVEYLEKLLQRTTDNVNALKCFHKSYKYIHNKRGIYYRPFVFVRSKNSLFANTTNREVDRSKQVCNFLTNLYSTCYRAFLFYSDDNYKHLAAGNLTSKLGLPIIRRYFSIIIQKLQETEFVGLLRMAYNIVPLLMNVQEGRDSLSCMSDVKWILKLIMTYLNDNGLPNCTLSNKNFLLFNNVNFSSMGDHEHNEKSILEFFQRNVKNFKYSDLSSYNEPCEICNHLSVKYFKENFLNQSTVFETYGNLIQFKFNGQTKTTKEIYEDEANLLINSQNYYLSYEIYFKFHIAVIYYELKRVLDSSASSESYKNITDIPRKLSNFKSHNFPTEFQYFFSRVKNFLDFLELSIVGLPKRFESELSKRQNEIEKQLKTFNIVFETNDNNNQSTVKCGCFKGFFKSKRVGGDKLSRDNFDKINFELLSKVSAVTKIIENNFFWKLKTKIIAP